jgi:hypothetical protein
VGDDLRIIAREPTWIDALIEIWAGDELLLTGRTEDDGGPFEATLVGPGTWADLSLHSSVAPDRVPLRTIICPLPDDAGD